MSSAQSAVQVEERIASALDDFDLPTAETQAREYLAFAPSTLTGGERPELSLWFRSRWLAAQVSLTAGDLRLALQRACPLTEVVVQLSPEAATRLWLLIAEAH